jgi:hypothetical protein
MEGTAAYLAVGWLLEVAPDSFDLCDGGREVDQSVGVRSPGHTWTDPAGE